ncbi:hypothetical protein M0R45_007042 [Rubus argutus]|uniref:Glabrous enhancer-binding protein-like DBD domain-containing protein n=1 Tax=Rubus argutus TaxID=59490 RepID=A0AAW1YT53_RUBAR
MASSALNENQHVVSSLPNNDLEGIVAADTFEGSSSESGDIKCVNEAHSRKQIEKKKKKKIAIPNHASSVVVDSRAAIPKRPREEKVDVNRSENRSVAVAVSAKRKKVKVAKSTTTSTVTADVNKLKPNNKSSSAGITWTDNEEMAILGGLISFNGENIQQKPQDFYMYIKDRLGKGDPIQVQKKVASLKKKYRRMLQQAQNNQASFTNSHEEMIFNLSKICWGEETKSETKNTTIADVDAVKINKKVQTPAEKKNVQIHMDKKNQEQKNEGLTNLQDQKNEGNEGLRNLQDQKNEGLRNLQDQKNEGLMNLQDQKNDGLMNLQDQKNEGMKNLQDQKNKGLMKLQDQKNEVLMNKDQMKEIQRSEIFQVLRNGLHNYFKTEPFDPMWAEAEEIDSLADDWKEFKIAEAKYKMAKAKFDMKAKGIAIEVYEEFGYPNDS